MTDEGASLVEVTRHGHVLVVEMRRADKRNAIDRAMADALDRALTLLDEEDDLWVGVLAADGPVFSAGSDLTAGGDYVTETGGEYGVIRRHRTKPLIAAVDGPALGGGFEIVLACDLVVASDAAVFGLPEVAIGLVPTCAGLFRAPRSLPLNLARELALTGDPISCSRAYAAGFVNILAPAGEARSEAVQLAKRICKNAPVAVRASLAAVNEMAAADDEAGWEITDTAKRTITGSADATEGLRAFLEKRAPKWSGR
ncbi:enoyl-CoA hydratase-related protein [Rhodococcus artemisiae]|uniref:Enoyl-CoA hydratase-related protein n=1 Tax=Rhodococcus artemisiae TaxID=714159 RepID=A0ABU7L6P9_9NOCA|nr:enoyl-CoA hydratase-related protein [Rhodococcus artemisiae]MEE2057225.1 enoyl-CoA hydratase-related protein [Rhodococcus artemisiae]